jgi:AraC-like DNA-binding protein
MKSHIGTCLRPVASRRCPLPRHVQYEMGTANSPLDQMSQRRHAESPYVYNLALEEGKTSVWYKKELQLSHSKRKFNDGEDSIADL